MRGASHRLVIVLLMAIVLVTGCGSSSPSPSPARSASPLPAPTSSTDVPGSTASPALLSTPTPTPADPFLGQVVVTVSDGLRVRSEPRVADDSVKYEPLLPLGTELTVLDGPVSASGYVWYQVAPVSFTGLEGPGHGWVALAAKDGEPWIALADAPIAGIDLAKANVARATADPAAAKTAAASITAFGLDLLRSMLADGTLKADMNSVVSPTSIALALGMALAGAKGETAAQMDKVLHTSGWDELGSGLNALEQELASHNATWTQQEHVLDTQGEANDISVSRELSVRIANSAFTQRDWSIEQTYLDRIASTFGAGVRLVDYRTDAEAARQTINAWVSDRTKKRIPELIPANTLDALTRLVLVNAIYLKADWARVFDSTGPATFTRLDGSTVRVPTMSLVGEQEIPYAQGNGWQATELRYRGANWEDQPLAMTLILPEDLAAFEARLTTAQLGRIVSTLDDQRAHLVRDTASTEMGTEPCGCGCYPYSLSLFMPRFSIETKAPLADVLKSMGMPLAVTRGQADFTGIYVPSNPAEAQYIQAVIHQANIDVDEKGTEAAAATAVSLGETGGCTGPIPSRTITLRLDRPFLFVLRDVETGAVLFIGRVVDPSVGR